MAVRRIRIRLGFLTVFSLICLCIFGLSIHLYKNISENFGVGLDIDSFKMGLHPDRESYHELPSKTARRNIIIVSHGRSGSSLMGDIFNHHPSVFYMYEPLQTPKRVLRKYYEGNTTIYSSLVERFLSGVFRCKFDQPEFLADIENYYRKSGQTRISNAMSSPPLCPYRMTDPRWDPRLCHPMKSQSLGSACKDVHNLTVVKVLFSRIPLNSIETVLNLCQPLNEVDCKVVFLVRDPRAVIPSSRLIGFFKETGDTEGKESLRMYSYQQCQQLEDNLDFIRKLPDSLRFRIRIQRYEDLARDPLRELSGLYKFASLTMLDSVRMWLNETTHLSRKDCTELDGVLVTCTKDDAWAAANRWRWKVHPHDIDLIEFYCGRVMRLMGYRPVHRSYDLLTDIKKPLYNDEYEAKHWVSK